MRKEDAMLIKMLAVGMKGSTLYFDVDWYNEMNKNPYEDSYTRFSAEEFIDKAETIGTAYRVRVWTDEDNFIDFAKANDSWFVCKKDRMEIERNDLKKWILDLSQSSLIPDYWQQDIKQFAKDLSPERLLLTAITGEPFAVKKWTNPNGKVIFKGQEINLPEDVARELAEFYIRIRN